MHYFNVSLGSPYHSICKKTRFDTHNSIKVLVFLDFGSLMSKIPFLSILFVNLVKIKVDSGSIYKRMSFKIMSCEIYLNMGDTDHELDFYDRFPKEKTKCK